MASPIDSNPLKEGKSFNQAIGKILEYFDVQGYNMKYCHRLGEGGQGITFQTVLIQDKRCTIKPGTKLVIKATATPSFSSLLWYEYCTIKRLQAQGLAKYAAYKVFSFDSNLGGQPYKGEALLMDYVKGITLTNFVRYGGDVSVQMCAHIALQLTTQAGMLHEKVGMAHLDIKPDNIIISEDYVVTLIDYGVSAQLESFTSSPGTPGFYAPEYCNSRKGRYFAHAGADVFSIGQTILYMLTKGTIVHPTVVQRYCKCPQSYQRSMSRSVAYSRAPLFFKQLMESMLQGNPSKRVTLSSVHQQLKIIHSIHPQNINILNYRNLVNLVVPSLSSPARSSPAPRAHALEQRAESASQPLVLSHSFKGRKLAKEELRSRASKRSKGKEIQQQRKGKGAGGKHMQVVHKLYDAQNNRIDQPQVGSSGQGKGQGEVNDSCGEHQIQRHHADSGDEGSCSSQQDCFDATLSTYQVSECSEYDLDGLFGDGYFPKGCLRKEQEYAQMQFSRLRYKRPLKVVVARAMRKAKQLVHDFFYKSADTRLQYQL